MSARDAKKARINKNPVVLIILDGWGIAPKGEYNAISLAKTPNFDRISREFGSIQICASGKCVGLSEGQMGNSEVGHLTIGSGRIIFQDLMRVHEEVNSGQLGKNTTLVNALKSSTRRGSAVHFLGLLSDGGVHSHIRHLFALLRIAKELQVSNVYVHVILDGRDTPPKSGADFTSMLQDRLSTLGLGKIATISGRYFAMDRDSRWERTKLAYDAIAHGEGRAMDDPLASIQESYDKKVTDEFFEPTVMRGYAGLKNGDVVVFYNFRPDRARQLSKALSFSSKEFGNLFDRRESKRPSEIELITMTNYDPKLKKAKSLIGRERIPNTLSNVLEKNGIRQLRIAETEKYAHVTYFFNGLVEKPRKFEDRILVPSLRIGTYDKSPEMSAQGIAQNAVRAVEGRKYGFILVNFANADMVGHSGNVDSTIKAVEKVDGCLGEIVETWRNGKNDNLTLLITADHGNAEKMMDKETGQPHTAHTTNSVPLCVVSKKWKVEESSDGKAGLSDLAPSILRIMRLEKPKVMTGRPIVVPKGYRVAEV